MTILDTYVSAKIDMATKNRASDVLEVMGLSISDVIRMLIFRIADEKQLPFTVKAPNAITKKAIAELASGRGKRFKTSKALMADLHADA